MRTPLVAYHKHRQYVPLDGHGGLHAEGSGEAALLKEAEEGDGDE